MADNWLGSIDLSAPNSGSIFGGTSPGNGGGIIASGGGNDGGFFSTIEDTAGKFGQALLKAGEIKFANWLNNDFLDASDARYLTTDQDTFIGERAAPRLSPAVQTAQAQPAGGLVQFGGDRSVFGSNTVLAVGIGIAAILGVMVLAK